MLKRLLSKRFNWEKLSAQLRTLTSRCLKFGLIINIAINQYNMFSFLWSNIDNIERENSDTLFWIVFVSGRISRIDAKVYVGTVPCLWQAASLGQAQPLQVKYSQDYFLPGCLLTFAHSGRMEKTDWSFTRMQIISLICGAQKCCSPPRRLVPREGGSGW